METPVPGASAGRVSAWKILASHFWLDPMLSPDHFRDLLSAKAAIHPEGLARLI